MYSYPLALSHESVFERYIGIDYSGAETPKSSLKGIRVHVADRLTASQEVLPPPSLRKYWTRRSYRNLGHIGGRIENLSSLWEPRRTNVFVQIAQRPAHRIGSYADSRPYSGRREYNQSPDDSKI
jgi:hypothetical protein